jgi:hypothetical protein
MHILTKFFRWGLPIILASLPLTFFYWLSLELGWGVENRLSLTNYLIYLLILRVMEAVFPIWTTPKMTFQDSMRYAGNLLIISLLIFWPVILAVEPRWLKFLLAALGGAITVHIVHRLKSKTMTP